MKYALFDWDGTLVDSMPFWHALPKRYCEQKGAAWYPELDQVIGAYTMVQAAQAITRMLKLEQTPQQTFAELKEMVRRAYWEEIPLKPGVADTLAAFQRAGVKMGIASASDRELIVSTLPRLGIDDYISVVRTCTDTGNGRGKDESPEVYRGCLRDLGGNPDEPGDAVIFDDALFAARTATAAGFTVAGVFEQSNPRQEELRKACRYYFVNAAEWRTLL